jgi:superoxide dismutase, Fe-Mn family
MPMSNQATAMDSAQGGYSLAPLPYGYADLEPVIDEQTMHLHHDKHHQAYTDGINAALGKHPRWQGMPIENVLRQLSEVPADIRDAVRNQGGGYANHNLFWQSLTPRGSQQPGGDLMTRINRSFVSMDQFMKRFEDVGTRHFGSGWVFLTVNPGASSALEIISLPNQDSPLSAGRIPLLACDLWEHAYYLKYNNRRPQWLHAWWEVVNWNHAAQALEAAHSTT